MIALHVAVLAYAIGNIITSSNVQIVVLAIYASIMIVSSLGTSRESDEVREKIQQQQQQCETNISENKDEEESSQHKKNNVDILLARYGTTNRDIDVTTKIQELVKDSVLKIPRSLDFNRFFGKDPARFSKKKLRLVALVNGKAVAHFLRESRKSDFVLGSDQDEKSSKEEEKEEEEFEDEETQPMTSPTTTTTTDLSSTHLVMTNIHTKFSNLQSQLPFGNVDTESLMSACDEIASMIGLFGASMLSVRASVTDNLVKIRKQIAMLDVGSDLRIETVIFAERDRGVMKKEGSVCLSMLWLKRSLDFMGALLDLLCSDKTMSTKQCALKAHNKTLAPWQGWFVRTACTTGMKLVPSRDSMYRVFGRTKTSDPLKIENDLKAMLIPFNRFVGVMDDWFEKNGFNFPEKC